MTSNACVAVAMCKPPDYVAFVSLSFLVSVFPSASSDKLSRQKRRAPCMSKWKTEPSQNYQTIIVRRLPTWLTSIDKGLLTQEDHFSPSKEPSRYTHNFSPRQKRILERNDFPHTSYPTTSPLLKVHKRAVVSPDTERQPSTANL